MEPSTKIARGTLARWMAPRVRGLTVAAVAGVLGLLKVAALYAQPGCTYTQAIMCGGNVVCTTNSGSNCVTCPR